MNMRRPLVSKEEVLSRYREKSFEQEEHSKMMSSKETWENRFEEVINLIPWEQIHSWLDVGCGTARLFERVIHSGIADQLEQCIGIDAVEGNLQAGRNKSWPLRPSVDVLQLDIEEMDDFHSGPFDLVTMVGVVYHCGLPPTMAIDKCMAQLTVAGGVMLVTTENTSFKGFIQDPHGCYPERQEFEQALKPPDRVLESLIVQYTNPLWRQRTSDIGDQNSVDYKEIFFLASYG